MNIAVYWVKDGIEHRGKLIKIVPSATTISPIFVVMSHYDMKFYCLRVDELTVGPFK